MTEKPWMIDGVPMDDDEAVKYLANQRMLLSRQLADANARIAELEEDNEALEFSVMDEDAILTLGHMSVDLERAEKRIAELEAKLNAVSWKDLRSAIAIPVDQIQAVLDCVGSDDWDTSEIVQLWLNQVQP